MDQSPKISIVTPSFNQGRFIEDSIKSVLSQNYPNFEHIIIDGGSNDETVQILTKYSHLIWVSEPDEGQSDAINKGFKRVTGEIVGWLNTDDYYLPNTFNVVANKFINSRADAIYGDSRFVDTSCRVISDLISLHSIKWMSLYKCFIPSETFFFRKKILNAKISIDKQFHIAMDMEFFAHIYYSNYKVEKINQFLGHFRWHDNNKSIKNKKTKSIILRESFAIFNRYSKIKLSTNKANLFLYKCLVLLCGFYRRCWLVCNELFGSNYKFQK